MARTESHDDGAMVARSTSSDNDDRKAESPTTTSSKWQKTYRGVGFNKGYNLPLFVIFAGAMFGFALARLMYLNVSGNASTSYKNSASPGEWYEYRKGHRRIGITLHLVTVVPMGLLMVWQFVPIVRHKLLIFHRINGYIVMILGVLGNVGALMIASRAFNGGLEVQSAVGMLVILTTGAMGMAYFNIKRLQIDQHRAWMLRAMFYYGVIITTRIIMIISAMIITQTGGFYQVQSCAKVAYANNASLEEIAVRYPSCSTPGEHAIVVASMKTYPEQIGSALGVSFGIGMWIAIFMHLVGVEIYLRLTPAESNRLRQVSYEKQLEAGYRMPGSAGLTSDKYGDAPAWLPAGAQVLRK